jgi:hypothetical protein
VAKNVTGENALGRTTVSKDVALYALSEVSRLRAGIACIGHADASRINYHTEAANDRMVAYLKADIWGTTSKSNHTQRHEARTQYTQRVLYAKSAVLPFSSKANAKHKSKKV